MGCNWGSAFDGRGLGCTGTLDRPPRYAVEDEVLHRREIIQVVTTVLDQDLVRTLLFHTVLLQATVSSCALLARETISLQS